MKLKTSFFDFTVLKKDLLRFWPAWGLYLIGGLLLSQTQYDDALDIVRYTLGGDSAGLIVINAVYGALIALLLFSDLFRARMCNALHALPVRREAWFASHTVAGILMSLVPNLVVCLLAMPRCAQFWYIPLLWTAEMTLMYLFTFGAAVLAIYLTGSTFAAVLVYGIFNFASLLAMWFVDAFYMPLLYGLRTNEDTFKRFSPVVYALENYEPWEVEHPEYCANCASEGRSDSYNSSCQYNVTFDEEIWVYLAIIAAVGVAFLVVSLLLYRRRRLESAGDFAAVKPMKTVFTVLGSITTGMVFYAFVGGYSMMNYIMPLLGGIVGFFVCQMLLQRTIKVFGGKSWLKLGALVAAVAISLGLTAVDVFGITRIVPDAENVVSVTIADSHLSQYDFQQLNANSSARGGSARGADPNYLYGKIGYVTLTESEQIQKAIIIHELLLQEGEPSATYHSQYTPVTIHYQLKNGTTLTRYYYGSLTGEAVKKLHEFTNTPVYILGVSSPEELIQDLRYVSYSCEVFYRNVEEAEWQQKLAVALWQDAEDGNLHQSFVGGNKSYVEFSYEYPNGRYGYMSLMVPRMAKNTLQWEAEYYAYLKEIGEITK